MPPVDRRSLRVGYVLKKFPRLSETFILNELMGLEAAGVDVGVMSLHPPDAEPAHPEVKRLVAAVHYLPVFGSGAAWAAFQSLRELDRLRPQALDRAMGFVERVSAEKRSALLVQGLLVANQVTALGLHHLHAHFMTIAAHVAYLAHVFTGVPYTVTAHAKDIFRETVDGDVFREVTASARALVTVSDYNRRFIADRFLRGDDRKVVRIYNGIPLDELAAPEGTREPDLVVAVGRLVEKKGFHLLLEAARRLVDGGERLKVVIIGDGDERGRLLADCERLELGGTVTFTGPLTRDEVLRWMRRARVLVAPCLRGTDGNQDALPTVLLEALAVGLPAVSTPVAGIPEIIEDGVEGRVVPENDVAAIAAAVSGLLHDDGAWRRMSAAGRVTAARKFDRTATLPHLLELFGGPDGRRAAPGGTA